MLIFEYNKSNSKVVFYLETTLHKENIEDCLKIASDMGLKSFLFQI